MNIETRKLQKNATGSFIVTLPKDWISRSGAMEGDFLMFESRGKSLEIRANEERRNEKRAKAASTDEAVALYIAGYDIIETMESVGKELMGIESSGGIVRVMVNTKALSYGELLKRQHAMTCRLFSSAAKATLLGNDALRHEVLRMMGEERKVHRFLLRKAVVEMDEKSQLFSAISCELDGISQISQEMAFDDIRDPTAFGEEFVKVNECVQSALEKMPELLRGRYFKDVLRRAEKISELSLVLSGIG